MDKGKESTSNNDHNGPKRPDSNSVADLKASDSISFANPKAPGTFQAPKLSRLSLEQRNKLTMTPRAVAVSVRAFSNIVMTPKADNYATNTDSDIVPRLKSSTSANANVRTIAGSKTSARDKGIFDNSEQATYIDRAAQRRGASKLAQADKDDEDDEEEELVFKVDEKEISNPQSLDSNPSLPKESQKSTNTTKPYHFKTAMAENICSILGIHVKDPSAVLSFRKKSDYFEKVAYSYDLSVYGEHPPSIISKSDQKSTTTTNVESESLIKLISAALNKDKEIKSNPLLDSINIKGEEKEDIFDDIFENVGEYVFKAKKKSTDSDNREKVVPITTSSSETIHKQIAFSMPTTLLPSQALPDSVQNIIKRSNLSLSPSTVNIKRGGGGREGKDEEEIEGGNFNEYKNSDAGYTFASDSSEGEDEQSAASLALTKRQKQNRDNQKADKELRKVTKIMDRIDKE